MTMPKLIAFLAKTSNAYRSASFCSICDSRLARRVVPPSGLDALDTFDPFAPVRIAARGERRGWRLAVTILVVLPVEGDPHTVSKLIALPKIGQEVPREVQAGRLLRRELKDAGRHQ